MEDKIKGSTYDMKKFSLLIGILLLVFACNARFDIKRFIEQEIARDKTNLQDTYKPSHLSEKGIAYVPSGEPVRGEIKIVNDSKVALTAELRLDNSADKDFFTVKPRILEEELNNDKIVFDFTLNDTADASQTHPTGKKISGTIRLIKKLNNKEFGTKRFCIRCNKQPQVSDISLENNNDSVVIKINHPNWHDIDRLDCEIELANGKSIPYKIENVIVGHELSFAIKDVVKGKVSPLQNASGNRSVYVTAIDRVGLSSEKKPTVSKYSYKSDAELELYYELGSGKQPVPFSTDRKATVNTANTIQKFVVKRVSDAAVAYYNNSPITGEFEVDLTNKTESTVTIKVTSEDEATTNTYTITVNKKASNGVDGSEQDAWKKLKNLVDNPNVSEIFINGEIKAAYNDEKIKVNRKVTISGKQQNKASTINANGICRIFEVTRMGDLGLNNITLKNGTLKEDTENGGAIYCGGGNITIKDCIIENCESEKASGGAIYCKEVSGDFTVRLTNTTITKCKAKKFGGAVASVGGKLIMENCTIETCQASDKAGAIYAVKDSYTATVTHRITLSDTKIKNCTATIKTGGAVIRGGTDFIIKGTTSFEQGSVVFLETAASIKVSAELTGNAPIMRLDIASPANNTTVVEGYDGYTLKAEDVKFFKLNPVSFGTGDKLELDGTVIRLKK